MKKWIITGGAGFIGSHAAERLHAAGHRVVLVDNLSRRGSGRAGTRVHIPGEKCRKQLAKKALGQVLVAGRHDSGNARGETGVLKQ